MQLNLEDVNGSEMPLRSPRIRPDIPNPNEHTGDGDARDSLAHRIDMRIHNWTVEVTQELISNHGEELIDMVTTTNGIPFLCDAIAQKQYGSAKLLLDHAQEYNRFVDPGTGLCETLEWAMNNRAEVVAKFVLDCIAEKRLPVDESCCILTNYLFPLITEFPDLMKIYIKNDKFSFEYGRFRVPHSLIDKNGNRPIAMTTDKQLDGMTMYTSETAREFWIEHCKEEFWIERCKDLKHSTDFQVEMAAKFFCIDQHAVRVCRSKPPTTDRRPRLYYAWNHVLRRIWTANLPLDIYESQAMTTLANWMFYSLYFRFVLLVILDILTAALFSTFAWFYGMDEDDEDDDREADRRQLISIIAIIVSCAVPFFSLLIRFSRIKILSILIKLVILHHVVGAYRLQNDDRDDGHDHIVGHPRHDDLSAFLTSVECVFVWFLVVEALLPFDVPGPFVSMVKDSFKAAGPFVILGAVLLLGFSSGIRVVFVYTDYIESKANDTKDETECGTTPRETSGSASVLSMLNDHMDQCVNDGPELDLPHTMKILFQASVRNFEEEKFRSMEETCFIGTWRSVLFSAFLFFGAIVFINLLVAILSDSFDKIKCWQKEELVKCRAEIVSAAFVSVAHDIGHRNWGVTTWQRLKECSHYCALKASQSLHSLASLKPRHRCKYFHYLIPVDRIGKEEDRGWEGRIKQLEKALKKEVRDIRTTVGQPESSPMQRAKTGSLFDQTSEIHAKVQSLNKDVKEIGDLLSQIQSKRSPSDSN